MEEDESKGALEAYQKKLAELQNAREADLKTRAMLKQILSPEAYERLMNIRYSNPEMYQQLASVLIYLAQNGQIKEKLSEERLKELISKLVSRRRETSIKTMHK